VLSLDALRAIGKTDALAAWAEDVHRRADASKDAALASCREKVRVSANEVRQYWRRAAASDPELQQAGARGLAYAIARVEAAALLLEHASPAVAQRWCARELAPLSWPDDEHRAASRAIADGTT
jgi:hypothetical protein